MADDDSSVRVAVRIRPQIAREVIDMCRVCTAVTPGEPQVCLGSDKAFTYDYVFNMDADQESLYHTCVAPLVDGSLDGYNATVLAYGQTGSGKTYTMGTGFDVALPDDQVGIIPRAIRHLFDGIKQRANKAVEAGDPAPEFSVVAQFMELYNEEVIDLFDPVRESAALKGAALGNGPALAPAVAVIPPQGHHKMGGGIRIHEDAMGGIYVVGVTMRAVRSAEEALQCLRLGALSRTTASTQMNTQSSRSHAIFTLHVKQQRMVRETNENEENGEMAVDVVSGNQPTKEFETLTAKFHFVDLAGSERLKRTGATGERAREGISINCGLLALGNVISALGDKSKRALHVPYRDSKLTRLLQDSLGGNSRTVMIACVSPSDRDFMETLNTLKYANRARNIKNRVTINQDKSSRTICLLRQEIQLLQLELMEYKQGKRVVGEDGTETVNDMFYENNMLQNENNNLRMRIKAMQETIDTLSSRNTQILAEKAAGSWINSGADSDVSEMIQGYVKEIEELRAKLLESEFTCQQLRKNAANVRSPTSGARNFGASPHVAMSGGYDISFGEMPSVGELLEKAKMEVKRDMQQLKQQYKTKRSRSVGVGAGGDEEGGEESGRNGNGMSEDGNEEKGAVEERGEEGEGEEDGDKGEDESGESDSEERGTIEENGSERNLIVENDKEVLKTCLCLNSCHSCSNHQSNQGGGDESESETDSEEKEDGGTPEEVNAQYGMELAELTSEINIKQKLIEELELSQRRLQSMRAHYEDKLTQLQRRIQDTQEERDKVLASITGGSGANQSLSAGSAGADKVKKVKEEYEKRLTDMKKELQRLQAAKKEHARLLRNQTHYETQMRQLRTDLTEMKRAKVKLVNKMKEELTRHKESDLRRAKEIAQLRKETRRNENKIRSLEADKRAKEAVLKRRNEEVSALRKQRAARGATGVLSARAAGHLRVKNVASTAKSFSPKAAKQKWQAMEKSISQIALGKQAVSALEMEMERLLQRRDHLGHSLEHALRKHNQAVMSHNTEESVLADLEEQIEGLRANIDYVQESIKECQTNIMQMEVAKEEAAPADVTTFVSSLQDLDEARYIIEKLFNMTVNQTCAVSQKESNIKEMEAQLTQEKKTSAVQNELLQHVLTQEQWDVFVRLEGIESGAGDDKEGTSPTYSSNASSRSASPERAASNPSFSIMGPPPPPSSTALTAKARRRTALPSELLYPNQNRGENREVSGEDSECGDVKSVSEDDASQKGSLTRVPSAPGSLKTLGNRVGGIGVGDGGQSTTVAQPRPSPFLGRRTYDQTQAHLATTSPRLARRNLGPSMSASANASSLPAGSGGYSSLGGRPGSIDPREQGLDSTPPNSPPGYRRQISREENVFSRLTSGTTVGSEHLPGQGVITLYQGRATPKAPLICTHIAEGHSKPVLSVCATDDLLFTASKDRTVKVWDLRRGEEIESLSGHPNNVVVVRYNEPSRLVFSVSAAYVKVWDLRLSPQSRCIKTLLSSGIGQNGPVVLNTPSRTLSLPAGEVHLNDVALNPNGTTLYTAGGDKVRVWDLRKFAATAKLTGGHQAAIMCLAVGKISEEEDIVVTGSKDHYIKVFEVNGRGSMNNYNPKVNLEPPHYDGIQALALHGDMLFSGSRDMAIKKWDLSKEELVQSVNNAHKDWVCGLTFMPGGGGQMLLSGCRSGVVRLWSSETCHLLGEMQAHSSPINALATNASHVFTACNLGTVGIWKSRGRYDLSPEDSIR
ncbi:kinesin-like protein KIF21A isoform X3 [Ischnura elegans]|uniref:kinesin-like protein KIF21A isoform X3 n=1 Tax=Ischnura elegans TaxID=197161 RepID=UPI001ED8A932|nr:kinesin-like protein KIF21A isoform X3 [Ischnura elegans]